MQLPAVGQPCTLRYDNSFARSYQARGEYNRVPAELVLVGVVIPSVPGLEDHVTLHNTTTGQKHIVPKHRILAVEGVVVDAPAPDAARDEMFRVTAVKTGKVYTVIHQQANHRNTWTCTCTGYQFRRNCRHILAAKVNG